MRSCRRIRRNGGTVLKALPVLLLAAATPLAWAQHGEHPSTARSHHGDAPATGLLGPYDMTREASGTAWQPQAAPMGGVHFTRGHWTAMVHGYADVIYDDQGGPRGDEKTFVPSMLMVMARRDFGGGALGVRTMVSLDPLMGRDGYPLLFQTGETADGATHLVDRQHPHDFFMELATTYSHRIGSGSAFLYLGLPGEPALGPATFMHRPSGVVIPEAPLTHHWLDSSHITFGVVTVGATSEHWKIEGSAFNGREPDQNRWNIETGALDSYAGRITWNPGDHWSMQASHGYLVAPEQLEPEVNVHRTTASVSHHAPFTAGAWSSTVAWGSNRSHGHAHAGWLAESALRLACTTLFARAEWLQNDELFEDTDPLAAEYEIGKLTLGFSQEMFASGTIAFSAGALASGYAIPDALEPAYGASPVSTMVFLRAAIR